MTKSGRPAKRAVDAGDKSNEATHALEAVATSASEDKSNEAAHSPEGSVRDAHGIAGKVSASGNTKSAWQAIGSIVIGATHLRNNKPCQDALFLRTEKDFAIACVADGHGSSSCPYSDEGAKAAVRVADAVLEEMLPNLHDHKDILLPKTIEIAWKDEIRRLHAEAGREPPPDGRAFPYILYGTTLLAAVAARDFIFALQIGDGNMLMVDKRGVRPVLAVAENVGEDTESLCLDDAWRFVRTQIIPRSVRSPAMFLLTTDGYSNSFADSAGFFKAGTDFFNIWREDGLDVIAENLQDWLRKSSDKGSGDDIAMGVMTWQ
ncbi:MAG: protein phosphatase 2C domain-containing protein [Defluviitaleaceae bacterium]|nr:protein phosphatase 2C domain-containing protein [Defluviitaleaceae bacterium]